MTNTLIPLKKAHGDLYCQFVRLYKDYITELNHISPSVKATVKESEILSICYSQEIEKFLIKHNDIIVGFLLIGTGDNKHPDSDYFIGEFYIDKPYQNKGIGKSVMENFINERRGRYCLYVLKNNVRAMYFWQEVFVKQDHSDCSYKYTKECHDENVFFLFFSPRNHKPASSIQPPNTSICVDE